MAEPWNAPDFCSNGERAAAKKLAGTNADALVMLEPMRVWTPEGERCLITPDPAPLWVSFLAFTRAASEVLPVAPAPAPRPPIPPAVPNKAA
jgi:hypothetical protein